MAKALMRATTRKPSKGQRYRVKDQYFGDARDYLKYQLLEALAGLPKVARLTCVWMLTSPDATGQGDVRLVEDSTQPGPTEFLQEHRNDRAVYHLREYFRDRRVAYVPYGDERPFFPSGPRRNYFDSIPIQGLTDAVVFFDPDNGLTWQAQPSKKHLQVEELSGVMGRMGGTSCAVVYQHANRVTDFWDTRTRQISDALRAPVGYVRDAQVGFYVIVKSVDLVSEVDAVLETVGTRGKRRFSLCRECE